MYPNAMDKDFRFAKDLLLAESSLGLSKQQICKALGVTPQAIGRWEREEVVPNRSSFEAFYSFLYSQGIRLNAIKAQLWLEENGESKILFHGSKEGISGALALDKSLPKKDFGKGFYCGESLGQSVSFVAGLPDSSAYIFSFDPQGLRKEEFEVDQEWMLTIAYFREQLGAFQNHPLVQKGVRRLLASDYVVAPIADNRMFELIGRFVDGEITDVQCKHCLSATSLGKQYVLLSPRALSQLKQLEHCYLCALEKKDSLRSRNDLLITGADKASIVRAKYKNQGRYIEEILQ